MQRSVGLFSCCLTISTEKTEAMYQPAPGEPYIEPKIIAKDQNLIAVNKFTYPGSILS